jgi:hypothetical protein
VLRSPIPLFIDIHEVTGATPEEIADAHVKDVAIQGDYGVTYVKYWMNEARGKVFCLWGRIGLSGPRCGSPVSILAGLPHGNPGAPPGAAVDQGGAPLFPV